MKPLGDPAQGLRLVPSERVLTDVASSIAGTPCQVEYCKRALSRATLVARDSVVVLNPETARFGDFLVAAAMARYRDCIRALGKRPRIDDVRRLLAAARAHLLATLPGLGNFVEDLDEAQARISWDYLRHRPLTAAEFGNKGAFELSRRSPFGSDVNLVETLLEAARAGHFPAYSLESFPDVEFLCYEMPMQRDVPTQVDRGALEEWKNLPRGIINQGVRCFRDSAEIQIDDLHPGWTTEGLRIGDGALHDAYVAFLAGSEAAMFAVDEPDSIFQWDPERYVVVLAVDMAGLPDRGIMAPAPSKNLVCLFARIFQQLGVAVRIVGFWDHHVGMPDGKGKYLSLEVTAKEFNEPFDDAAVLRVVRLMDRERYQAETSMCHIALHHHMMLENVLEEVARRDAQVAQVFYFGSRWSGGLWRSQQNVAQRMADAVEQMVVKAKGDSRAGTVVKWGGMLVVPREVRDVAKKGGWIGEQVWNGG